MATTTHNRRRVLAAMGALPVAAIAAPAFAQAADRGHWDALVADYQDKRAEMQRLGRIYNEAEKEGQRQTATLPPRPVAPTCPPISEDMTLRQIKALPLSSDHGEYKRAVAAWEANRAAVRQRCLGEAEPAWEAAVDQVSEAAQALAAYPSPTLAILGEKIEILFGEYGDDLGNGAENAHIYADIRRLAAEA